LKPTHREQAAVSDDAPNWGRRFRRHPSQLRAIVKPRNWREYAYPFIYGQVEYDELTASRWRHCSRLATTRAHMRSWVDDQVMHDDPLLVEQIVQRVLPRRAIRARPEEVLITIGTQNSLYLLADLLGQPGTVVGLENPGYVDARNIFGLAGCELLPLRIDAQGLVTNAQLAPCDMVFCTPSHQAPTGVTMPVYRRLALLEMARQQDFVVIEDDYETEHNVLGGNHPALKSFDTTGRVIYLGSLTKNLLPGVRLGFIVADEELIQELRAQRRYMYRHPPLNNQRAMALFLAMGYYDEHAGRLRDRLALKWRLITQAMHRHLPDFHCTGMPGGSSLWVQGPPGFDAWALQRRAAKLGVLLEPGDIHFSVLESSVAHFRLGFGAISDGLIEPGIRTLAEAWRAIAPAEPALASVG
jgi:GntR family transcriptional regulator / MocR family aminotransferase